MNCKDYEELLMRLPFNELSEEEAERLRKHLEVCEHCNAELRKNEAVYRLTQSLKASAPEDEKKAESIRNIINTLVPRPREPFRRLMPNRTVRWIINAAAIFLVGLFLVQQVEMKQRLRSLDAKITSSAVADPPPAREYAFPELTSLPEDRLILLIEEYEQVVSENQAILDYLLENHPEIYEKIKELSPEDISSVNEL